MQGLGIGHHRRNGVLLVTSEVVSHSRRTSPSVSRSPLRLLANARVLAIPGSSPQSRVCPSPHPCGDHGAGSVNSDRWSVLNRFASWSSLLADAVEAQLFHGTFTRGVRSTIERTSDNTFARCSSVIDSNRRRISATSGWARIAADCPTGCPTFPLVARLSHDSPSDRESSGVYFAKYCSVNALASITPQPTAAEFLFVPPLIPPLMHP